MPHEVPFEDLVDLVEGRLSPAEADLLEAHIAGCAECAAQVAWLRRVTGLMAADRLVDAPRELVARAQALYRAPQSRPLAGLAALWRGLWTPQLRRAGALALSVLLLIGALWASSTIPVAQAATLASVSGQVEVQRPGSSLWQPASAGLKLEAGSAIRAGAGASAVVEYPDGSRTTLGESTQIRILAIDGRRNQEASTVRLSQESGHTQHQVASAHSSIQVETSAAIAEASEGSYEVWVEAGETEVAAASGKVAVSAGQSRASLAAGERGRASAGEVRVGPSRPNPTGESHRPTPEAKPVPTDTPAPAPTEAKPGRGADATPTPKARPEEEHGSQRQATPGPGRPQDSPREKPRSLWFWPWGRLKATLTPTAD